MRRVTTDGLRFVGSIDAFAGTRLSEHVVAGVEEGAVAHRPAHS